MSYRLTFARTLALTPGSAYATILDSDPRRVFDRRYMVLAPLSSHETDDQWGAVGGTRGIRASDSSSFCEVLTELDPPRRLRYDMTQISGPLRLIAREVSVCWTFDHHPHGARIAWSWEVTPPNRLSAALESFFRPQWSRYAGRALGRLEVVGQERARRST